MPAVRFVIVVLVPLPLILPGFIVQVPVDGNPFKITLPVELVHVVCVIVPTVGAVGVTGCIFITTLAEATDVQATAFVTV